MLAVPDLSAWSGVVEAGRIVRVAAETLTCSSCGWLLWEHAVGPERCPEVTR